MTQEQIDAINQKCPYGQGIFFQPNGVPTHIKENMVGHVGNPQQNPRYQKISTIWIDF